MDEQTRLRLEKILADYNLTLKTGDEETVLKFVEDNKSDIALIATDAELAKTFAESMTAAANQPWFKNKRFLEDLGKGLQDAYGLFVNIAETSDVKQQRLEADKQLAQLEEPAAPIVPKVPESLSENVERSRRELSQEPTGFVAAREKNLQLLSKAINNAKTASTGNASTFGSMAQGAINQARQSSNELGGMQVQDRQRRIGNLNNALRLEEASKMGRTNQRINIYGQQLENYNQLAGAVGLLGQDSRNNALQNRRNYADIIPGISKFTADLGYGAGKLFNKGGDEQSLDPGEATKIQEVRDFQGTYQDSLSEGYNRNSNLANILRNLGHSTTALSGLGK